MGTMELDSRIKELRELRRMADEINAEIEMITDGIKAEMQARNTDTLTGIDWKVTWKEVVSSRIDTTALKKAMPEIAAAFTKSSTSRRFNLTA